MNLCKYSTMWVLVVVALLGFSEAQLDLNEQDVDEMEKVANFLILSNLRSLLDLHGNLVKREQSDVSVQPRSLTLTDLIIKNKKSSSLPPSFVQFLKNPQNRQKFELLQKLFEQEVENYRQLQRMIYSYGR